MIDSLAPPTALVLATAWRLVDPDLVGVAIDPHEGLPDEAEWLVRVMTGASTPLDPIQAEDAVRWSIGEAPTTAQALDRLVDWLMTEESGQPVVRPHRAWHQVARIVDGDLLVCWHRCLPGPLAGAAEDLGWGPVLRRERGPFHDLLRKPMADIHVHLGGAVPTSLLWNLALAGGVPLDLVFPTAQTERGRQVWAAKLESAACHLEALARAAGTIPPGTGPVERRALFAGGVAKEEEDPWPLPTQGGEDSTVLRATLGERCILVRAMRQARLSRLTDPHPAAGQAPVVAHLVPYIRIRNAFHRALLHGPGARGLRRFLRSFSRRSFVFRSAPPDRDGPGLAVALRLEELRVAQVLESYLWDAARGTPRTLGAHLPPLDVELRVSPAAGEEMARTLMAQILGVRRAIRAWNSAPLRAGFVIHLLKGGSTSDSEGALEVAQGLVAVLQDRPFLRPFVVGLDVAGDELACSPRQYARAFRLVRSAVDDQRDPGGAPPIQLGFTYHAGEDYRDLCTGIRRVDEALDLLPLRAGDRIGHGLALAFDPGHWYSARPEMGLPLGEHLLDLLWAWLCLREHEGLHDKAEGARLRLHGLIARSKRSGSGNGDLLTAMEQLAARLSLEHHGRARTDVAFDTEDAVLAHLGLSSTEGARPFAYHPNPEWSETVASIQRLVRKKCRARGIIIELNPSSNLFISGLNNYSDLPYLALRSADPVQAAESGLRVCLNTDDPGIFQTTLRGEYLRMGEALLAQGVPLELARKWLNDARKTSLEGSFLPPWLPRGEALAQLIDRTMTGREFR